jgi:hypothetical protein
MLNFRYFALALASLCLAPTFQLRAAALNEDFSTNPAVRGWRAVGQTNLFSWNPTNQNLEVTWDSSQSNSFYCLPLGTVLAATDDFSLAFDLRLDDCLAGANPAKPYSFELAIGLLNLAQASGPVFLRGAGSGLPNLFEFDYFPDDGSGFSSLDATMSDLSGNMQFYYANTPLSTGDNYRVSLNYSASNKTVTAWMSRSNEVYCLLTNSFPSSSFGDFRLDHLAICSYSDQGQDPLYGVSILAHGVVDNFAVNLPQPPVTIITGNLGPGGNWLVTCGSQTNWLYNLERTTDLQSWSPASPALSGNGTALQLQDTNAPWLGAFYRVRAVRP